MNSSTVIFTVVPSAVITSPQRATVLVSPRLYSSDAAPTLGSFDFGSFTWPERLELVGSLGALGVRFNGGAAVATPLAPPLRAVDARDGALWRALFPATRRVIPYAFEEKRNRTLRPFPAADMAAYLLDAYHQAAVASPAQFPPVGVQVNSDGFPTVVNPLDELVRVLGRQNDLLEELAFAANEDPISRDQLPLDRALYQALRFYRRRPRIDPSMVPPEPPGIPDFDFHQQVALLADHPTLMRKLGLAFDILLPSLPPVPNATLELVFSWRSNTVGQDVFPRTHYVIAGGKMLPQAQHPELQDAGYARLERADLYPIVQVDIDGAVLKAVDFAVATRRLLNDPDQPPISESSLPALRSGGLTITQKGRAQRVFDAFARQASANGSIGGVIDLYADDLARGYRIDVEVDGRWLSLCRRVGSISAAGRRFTIDDALEEEGYVKGASAAAGPYDGRELYLHEAIAGWSGYSLCARPPGGAVAFEADRPPGQREQIVDGRNHAGPYLDVQAEYTARRGSLPALRFGKSYRLRARIVDVAGGGLPFTDADASAASPRIVYGRYEPVGQPVLAQRTAITEGESLEQMVIRSRPGVTPADYANLPEVAGAGYAAENHRHALPPKAALDLVERHGLLDEALGSRARARALFNLAQRESGSIAERVRLDLDAGPGGTVPHLELRNPPSGEPGPSNDWPAARGEPLKAGQYVLHTGASIELNYLPDPMATGMAIWDPQASADDYGPAVIKKAYPASSGAGFAWARKQSLRIELRGATDGHVHRDDTTAAGVVGIALPPGRKLTLRYASILDESRLGHMAMWNQLSASEQASAYPHVKDGKFWMITPARELTLVHAVQRPVAAASFAAGLSIDRDAGSSTVRLTGSLTCHSYSTSHVDVRARWTEILDLVDEPQPRLEDRQAEAFRLPVSYGQDSVPTGVSTETVVRTPFTTSGGHRLLRLSRTVQTRPGLHELGDTKHRQVTYDPVSTTRYQEYFPAAMIADPANLETAGVTVECSLPASARPEPPRVAHIVPTFRWSVEPDGSSKRRGGVRIYLERPWFSSGAGERLAVIVPRYPVDVLSAEHQFVSQWGRDPAWTRESPPALSINSFEYPDETVTQLGSTTPARRVVPVPSLPLPDTTFVDHAVLLVPEYSVERGLWFCDLDLVSTASYWPFLSLALARYQPDALPGLQLSRIVRAEFVQVAPDRVASVTVSGTTISVRVSGVSAGNALEATGTTSPYPPADEWARYLWLIGPAYSGKPGGAHRVRARLEKRAPADGDLGWQPVDAVELVGNQNGDVVDWLGTITRPAVEAGKEYRVVVTEAEMYAADTPGTSVNLGWDWASYVYRYADGKERIVYVDVKLIS